MENTGDNLRKLLLTPAKEIKFEDIESEIKEKWTSGVHTELLDAANKSNWITSVRKIFIFVLILLGLFGLIAGAIHFVSILIWNNLLSLKTTSEALSLLEGIAKNNNSIFNILNSAISGILGGLFVAFGHYIKDKNGKE